MSKKSFIQDCINADALLEEIDDYIDFWHDNDIEATIYEFLGMSQKEYRMWVENDKILKYIFTAHVENKDIDDVLSQEYNGGLKMVARAKTPGEAKFIYNWLVRTGRIEEN
ncbi:hypothetical protein DP73_09970 [Desulfosporosinus sp. HMP52]|uniref:hypothetical protein n=1 Tax=Desulfosporosinus sp. HMP52 TaxID=1487923 RepID=UPI00051FB9FA|nr:hypothetical protein [Desulfosporosinus sp. HMP52]KGK89374.1 hypothetical protein DP73_09970 [Desulfosporosinus sp. HMP52]